MLAVTVTVILSLNFILGVKTALDREGRVS
jgi:hypothetical protein